MPAVFYFVLGLPFDLQTIYTFMGGVTATYKPDLPPPLPTPSYTPFTGGLFRKLGNSSGICVTPFRFRVGKLKINK